VVVYSPENPSAPSGSGLLGCGADKITGIAWPSNVIEAKAEGCQGSHSAPFPRALVEFFVKAFSDPGDSICDPFMGSGTTMAAAHVLGRTGYRKLATATEGYAGDVPIIDQAVAVKAAIDALDTVLAEDCDAHF
jgi:hypothetical protein